MAGAGTTTQVGGYGGAGGAGGDLLSTNNLSDVASAATSRTNLGFSTLADYVTLTGTQTLTNKTLTSPTVTSLTATGATEINTTGSSGTTIGNSGNTNAISLISKSTPTVTTYTTSTNTAISNIGLYTKSTSGTPGIGYGNRIDFYADTNGGTDRNVGYISSRWSGVVDASRSGYFEFRVSSNASIVQAIDVVAGGLNIYGTTNGVVSVRAAATAGTWTLTLPATNGNANEYWQTDGNGVSAWAPVTDALLSTSDITTNDVSTTKHGFAPKAPNDATKFLNGVGAWSVPAGGGGGGGVGSSIAIYKSSDESVTSSTALQNDGDFSFAIGANESWVGKFTGVVTNANSGGFKMDFTLPAGATGSMRGQTNPIFASTGIGTPSGGTNAISGVADFTFVVNNSSTAGTVQLQWAQFTSNATATVLKAGTVFQVTRTA